MERGTRALLVLPCSGCPAQAQVDDIDLVGSRDHPVESADHVAEGAAAAPIEDFDRPKPRPRRDANHAGVVIDRCCDPGDVRAVAVVVIPTAGVRTNARVPACNAKIWQVPYTG